MSKLYVEERITNIIHIFPKKTFIHILFLFFFERSYIILK